MGLGMLRFVLAYAIVLSGMVGCSDSSDTASNTSPAPITTPDVGYHGDEAKPRWLRFERGARGFLFNGVDHDSNGEGPDSPYPVKVCDTPEEWVSSSSFQGCKDRPVGQIVTVRKTDLMLMISEPSPIQVQAASWRGVMAQDEIVPIIPFGTNIDCSGADGPTTLQRPDESDNLSLDGDVVFRTTHLQNPKNAAVVDVVVVSGNGKGKRGKLAFNSLDCKIDGFLPEFDNEDTEQSSQ